MADMTAPPGAPGAAIMMTPSMRTKGMISPREGRPTPGDMSITALVQVTMVMVEPER